LRVQAVAGAAGGADSWHGDGTDGPGFEAVSDGVEDEHARQGTVDGVVEAVPADVTAWFEDRAEGEAFAAGGQRRQHR
jgi:hypothetical protein